MIRKSPKCIDCGIQLTVSVNWSNGREKKKYYVCNECNKKRNKKYRKNNLYEAYIHDAKKRNYIFSLSRKDFEILVSGDCYYCGTSPANGVDRMDNAIGYTTENSVPCCSICNKMKLDLPLKLFISQCKKISRR